MVRKGESSRFKPFSKLPNRKLLWHGSRVTNMAGILSQGLRIAPPEAPVTGIITIFIVIMVTVDIKGIQNSAWYLTSSNDALILTRLVIIKTICTFVKLYIFIILKTLQPFLLY